MANSGRIVGDCRDAAKALADSGQFETGQAILLEAAEEIERLREALVRYGNRAALSNAKTELQPAIDMAFAINLVAIQTDRQ